MSEFVFLRPKRRIGTIIPNVTIEEAHTDRITITDHPVEQGAAITDHAYKNPAVLNIYCGWSGSSIRSAVEGVIEGGLSSLVGNNYVRDVYEKLLVLQESRELIDVSTGKRLYKNMLVESLATVTDEKTEFTLLASIGLRQVIITQTQTTTVPPREVQEDPEKTAETTQEGTKQAQPSQKANTSALAQIFGG